MKAFVINVLLPKIGHFRGETSRVHQIRTSPLFTRFQQAFKLKFAPLFAPLFVQLTNLKNQTINFNQIKNLYYL